MEYGTLEKEEPLLWIVVDPLLPPYSIQCDALSGDTGVWSNMVIETREYSLD